jgi:hypothetical protein
MLQSQNINKDSEENKMKTRFNKTSIITRAFAIIIVSVVLSVRISAQGSSQYLMVSAAGNVKYMVYRFTNVLFEKAASFIHVKQNAGGNGYFAENMIYAGLPVSKEHTGYTVSATANDRESSSLEAFLISASGLKDRIEAIEENSLLTEDNTLEEFLTEAARLNDQPGYSDDVVSESNGPVDNSLEEFLIKASGLRSSIINVPDQLEEFLIQASGLKSKLNEDIL